MDGNIYRKISLVYIDTFALEAILIIIFGKNIMKNTEKISPMTVYYLRKLIQSNQAMLPWEKQDGCFEKAIEKTLSKTVHARIRNISYPSVLEQLVALHKNLHTAERENIVQIQDIESQIYRLLGFQKKDESIVEKIQPQKPSKTSLLTYHYLLKILCEKYTVIPNYFDVRVTLNYVYQVCSPSKSWLNHQGLWVKKPQKCLTQNHLQNYECWTNIFAHPWEPVTSKLSNVPACEVDRLSQPETVSHSRDRDWQDLRQIVRLASQISNNPASRRSRDLVKILNAVSVASAEIMGALRTRYYLIESRPQDEWCHMFMISDAGSTTYCGSIREIVTATRLKQFEGWMRRFWQMCEAKRDDIFLQLT